MGVMKNILILLVLAGLGYAGYGLLSGSPVTGGGLSSSEGVTSVMEAKPAKADYALRILFIGNSYTFTHNMPQQMVEMARSDSANRTHYMVQSVTKGGIGLPEMFAMAEVQQALADKEGWHYVVLQDQSFWAMFPDSVINTIKIAREYDKLIKQSGARTLLFTTWARKPDSHWYSDQETAFLKSPDYMQKKFNEQTQALAEKIGAVAIPVGGYWAYVNNALPDIDLYSADATHPSVAGSYLSAAVFYRYLSGGTLETVSYVPPGISAETAKRLREVIK